MSTHLLSPTSPVSLPQHKNRQNHLGGHIFHCIDAHTCGNPVRLVSRGGPALLGNSMSEKRQYFLKEFDWVRKGLMFEPRGHDMMSGAILYPSQDPKNDVAVLFIETSGCLPMCGHGMIGTVTIAIEEGLVQPISPGNLRLETPAGIVRVTFEWVTNEAGHTKVKAVKLVNVPSFLAVEGVSVELPGLGKLSVDVSYGGNFYAIVDMQENFKGIQAYTTDQLIVWSRILREQINLIEAFVHPLDQTIRGCSHVLWTGEVKEEGSSGRNAVFYGQKAIDRSPCGTGTSARMAQWYAKGKLGVGDLFIHESIIGSKFIGKVEEAVVIAGKPAIVPSIEGWAKVYGYNIISIDPADDPYANGFQVP